MWLISIFVILGVMFADEAAMIHTLNANQTFRRNHRTRLWMTNSSLGKLCAAAFLTRPFGAAENSRKTFPPQASSLPHFFVSIPSSSLPSHQTTHIAIPTDIGCVIET
jgi:hypothetical protein